MAIWLSAVFAAIESYRKLVGHESTHSVGLGIGAAVLGIVGNQVVAADKRRVGHRIGSATLLADAQHSWLDALSSAGALVGLVLVAFGQRWSDPVAGFAVTLFIAHVGFEVTRELVDRLMDGCRPGTGRRRPPRRRSRTRRVRGVGPRSVDRTHVAPAAGHRATWHGPMLGPAGLTWAADQHDRTRCWGSSLRTAA